MKKIAIHVSFSIFFYQNLLRIEFLKILYQKWKKENRKSLLIDLYDQNLHNFTLL